MADYEFRRIAEKEQHRTVGKPWRDSREIQKNDPASLAEVQEMGRRVAKAQGIDAGEVVLVQLEKAGRSRIKGNPIVL
jgi:hypothetical protein